MYNYEELKPRLFTDEGQRLFLKVRDNVNAMLKHAGAVRAQETMVTGPVGDTWTLHACLDRLVELGEIREVPQGKVAGQYRIFVKADE